MKRLLHAPPHHDKKCVVTLEWLPAKQKWRASLTVDGGPTSTLGDWKFLESAFRDVLAEVEGHE